MPHYKAAAQFAVKQVCTAGVQLLRQKFLVKKRNAHLTAFVLGYEFKERHTLPYSCLLYGRYYFCLNANCGIKRAFGYRRGVFPIKICARIKAQKGTDGIDALFS